MGLRRTSLQRAERGGFIFYGPGRPKRFAMPLQRKPGRSRVEATAWLR